MRTGPKFFHIFILLLLTLSFSSENVFAASKTKLRLTPQRVKSTSTTSWSVSPQNPILARGKSHFGLDSRLIWNDPSVLKEEDQYVMWVSAGFSSQGARIYRLISQDGIEWKMSNEGRPVLEPSSDAKDFDCVGVETPVVIKVNDQYHLYYSAYKKTNDSCTAHTIFVTMGHAVSSDGLKWTKKGELTSLTSGVGNQKDNLWGWLGRAEPAVVFFKNKFYLYFTDIRCRKADCSGLPAAERGISLAISDDGHQFRQVKKEPVLLQGHDYPVHEGWEGYSTPWALIKNDGSVELFVDVAKTIKEQFYQTAIAHFSSLDGESFSLVSKDIVTAGVQNWASSSVRAPSVLQEGHSFKMWFAGDNANSENSISIITGIGMAHREN